MSRYLWARCSACNHVWQALTLPIPMDEAAKQMKALACPSGCTSPIYVANDGSMFASVRRPASQEELAEHRIKGTDPYEDLARRLIIACTEDPYRDIHLYEGDAAVVIRSNGNFSTYGHLATPETQAAADVAFSLFSAPMALTGTVGVKAEDVNDPYPGYFISGIDDEGRDILTPMAASQPSVGGRIEEPHLYAVTSSDYAHPFLLGAYPTLDKAIKAQGGHPQKWDIFVRVVTQ